MKKETAIGLVIQELEEATAVYPPFNSAHEGYAVILEEADELWDEVKRPAFMRDNKALKEEAIQVAANALRFLVDVVK